MSSEPLHNELISTLGREIVDGVLSPGSTLTLESIGTRFGVSRTVAREATHSLELLRLVLSRRRVGIVVLDHSHWDVLNPHLIAWRLAGPGRDEQLRSLTEMRIGVEPIAASSAASEIEGRAAAELCNIAERMQVHGLAGELDDFIELDNRFHELILVGSGNEMFAALSVPILAAISGRSHIGMMPQHPEPEAIDLHVEVARAIAAREPARAERAMRKLLAEVHLAMRLAKQKGHEDSPNRTQESSPPTLQAGVGTSH